MLSSNTREWCRLSGKLCKHGDMQTPVAPIGTWLIDLDGVVWLSDQPIAGSATAIGHLRDAGIRIAFATNNSAPTVSSLVERLKLAGIDAEASEIVTSAQAAASLLGTGSTALVCGSTGLIEALADREIEIRSRGPVDAVVVGWTDRFDFEMLTRAAMAVRDGARFIGTNEDPTHPTPMGLHPGSGAILAAVATAAEAIPEVAGKPHEPMAALVRERYPDASLMVGDRPATDGVFASRLGIPFALVLSGVTGTDDSSVRVNLDFEVEDLSTLVHGALSGDLAQVPGFDAVGLQNSHTLPPGMLCS